jgi:hypothetical protein
MQEYKRIIIGTTIDRKKKKIGYYDLDTGQLYSLDGDTLVLDTDNTIPNLLSKPNIKSGSGITDSDGVINVVFTIPMVDANYAISLSSTYKVALSNMIYGDKSITGFTIFVRKNSDGIGFADVVVDWTAIPYNN